MNTVELNNGIKIPLLGFGVFQITDQQVCEQSVLTALQTGYRMIDTAACYGNERAVGAAIQQSGTDRKEIFLISKVWIQDTGYEKTKISFEKTLCNLQTDYLDLYLIHMPFGDYHSSWKAMEEFYREGRIRAIGVCNFLPDRLIDLIFSHEIVPMVNQIELHPFYQEKELRQMMAQYNIQPMAWAPFAEGQKNIFRNELLSEIGKQYGKSSAQVILRWLYQNNIAAIPKSVHPERIKENFRIDDFTLSSDDMQKIEAMDRGKSLILDIQSLDEVKRLHNIRFAQ
ncbi:MAG TPA: aldo/keto reductase [Candidatus Anaerotignum merdipullorum]|nr:aldo/keto reductase [Candidatus Anaerotignum merdipullorum]